MKCLFKREIGNETIYCYAGAGALMGHFTKGLGIQGITSGLRSFQYVMRTKFTNMIRHIYNISFKTVAKRFVAMTVSRQVLGNVGKCLYRSGQEWWEYLRMEIFLFKDGFNLRSMYEKR